MLAAEVRSLLTDLEVEIAEKIFRKGILKANKPKVSFTKDGYRKIYDETEAKISYLWARVAYYISPYRAHSAQLPDIRMLTHPQDSERLNEIASLICECVPKARWYGLYNRGEM